MKTILKLTIFDLKNNKRQIIGWTIAMFSIMFLYMILFPSMQEMAEVKMKAMPEELLQLFGMEDFTLLNNYIAYYSMILNVLLIPLSIYSAIYSAGLFFKEEKFKSIEFLNCMPVNRSEIYFSKVIAGFVGVFIVCFLTFLSALICGFLVGGDTFDLSKFITMSKLSGFIPFLFAGIAFFISGFTAKISTPMLSSMTVLITYMFGYLSKLLENKAEWLSYFSPFQMLSPQNCTELTSENITRYLIIIFITLLLVLFGNIFYKKRDLKI